MINNNLNDTQYDSWLVGLEFNVLVNNIEFMSSQLNMKEMEQQMSEWLTTIWTIHNMTDWIKRKEQIQL